MFFRHALSSNSLSEIQNEENDVVFADGIAELDRQRDGEFAVPIFFCR